MSILRCRYKKCTVLKYSRTALKLKYNEKPMRCPK